MNEQHLKRCASAEWAETVEREILPWALGGRDLGDDILEVGPGPGLTTDVLRRSVKQLTAVEVDADLARALASRLSGCNVEVLHADATALPFEHEDPHKQPSQDSFNPWSDDIREAPSIENSPRARDSSVTSGRSGSDSNASRRTRGH